MRRASGGEGIRAWILREPGQPEVVVWGVPVAERLRRALLAAGVPNKRIGAGPASAVSADNGPLLIFRSDYVFDDRLVRAMVAAEHTVLLTPRPSFDRQEAVAAHVEGARLGEVLRLFGGKDSQEHRGRERDWRLVSPPDLVPAYTASLRKADPPYLLPASPERVAEIEARIFAASYKGVTDLVTKWVWPVPARVVTRWLAHAKIHPNVVTILSWALVVLAVLLFIRGQFGLGLVAAWVMTFLDTVDGKLARVTLTSSRTGHVLDHGLDLLHPPFWYLAWAIGLRNDLEWIAVATGITVGGYVVGRLIEGIFLLAFKMEIHCWRPIDSAFRTITARRNPNLLLLTAGTLVTRPDLGLGLVALWTVCSIGFHMVRLAHAFVQRWRGLPMQMWQDAQQTGEETRAPLGSAPHRSESLA